MIFIGLLHLLNSELEEQLTILYQEVRNNKITREEAVNLVRKFDSEFLKDISKIFLIILI